MTLLMPEWRWASFGEEGNSADSGQCGLARWCSQRL